MLVNPKDLSNFSAAVLSFQDKPGGLAFQGEVLLLF